MPIAIGLMSGTSADGVTAAAVRFTGKKARVIKFRTLPYPKSLRERVLGAARMTAPELSRLDMELGAFFAKAAKIAGPRRAQVIGSHGQTIWHGPEERPANSFQLGEPAVIAEETGLPVVADFRPRDIASGGQGAPLTPAFDHFLFAQGPLRAVQNIGGIANVSIVGRGKLWKAFDTGPGNCLMDLSVRLATGGRRQMDEGGRLAARGRPDRRKVDALIRDSFFRKSPPKPRYLRWHFGRVTVSRLPDTLATLALLTARSIEQSYRRFVLPIGRPKEVIVSGGGALNPHLMRLLRELLAPFPVVTSRSHGIHPMAKEAVAFAWMALRAQAGKSNNCPSATGARGPRILGKLTPR